MGFRTDNPILDAELHDRQMNRRLEQRPECNDCGEYIQDEHFYLINDEFICPDCIEKYRKWTEDYIA